MDGVVVAGEAIDQCGLGQGRQAQAAFGWAFGQGVGRWRLGDGATMAAVAAQEVGGGHAADQLVAVLVAQFLFQEQQGALAFALVQHVAHAVMADVGLAGLQGSENLE
ncbi:hypothetical protein D3C84_894810 [compost metagenome]